MPDAAATSSLDMPNEASPRERYAAAAIRHAPLIDRQLAPLGLLALRALDPQPGETILDIGCGMGQTVLQLAEHVGSSGQVIGVDIEPAFLEIAKIRALAAPQARFIAMDAAHLNLPDASVDGIFSRFGVMAFEDPLRAFANFRRMAKPGARLSFTCWRSLEENELDHLPVRAAALPNPVDPGPFSMECPSHVERTLRSAGFRDLQVTRMDRPVSAGNVDSTLALVTGVGALGRILREHPELLAEAAPRVRIALDAKERARNGDVWLNAACWLVTGRA